MSLEERHASGNLRAPNLPALEGERNNNAGVDALSSMSREEFVSLFFEEFPERKGQQVPELTGDSVIDICRLMLEPLPSATPEAEKRLWQD